MSRYSLRSVLEWLRSGYPEGIPTKDHFAVLAVLRRRLTAAEVDEVVALAIATAHEHPERQVDYDRMRAIISGVIHDDPSEEDLTRVSERLEAGGWPVTPDEDQAADVE